MAAAKHNICEDRRIQWMTYKILRIWFDGWGEDLVKLGFAHHDANSKVIIEEVQLSCMLNFDETCLWHDGKQGGRRGRPEDYLFVQWLPRMEA